MLLLIWSVTLTIWVRPSFVGVVISCIAFVLIYILLVFLMTWSSLKLGEMEHDKNITEDEVKNSWLEAKLKYFE